MIALSRCRGAPAASPPVATAAESMRCDDARASSDGPRWPVLPAFARATRNDICATCLRMAQELPKRGKP